VPEDAIEFMSDDAMGGGRDSRVVLDCECGQGYFVIRDFQLWQKVADFHFFFTHSSFFIQRFSNTNTPPPSSPKVQKKRDG